MKDIKLGHYKNGYEHQNKYRKVENTNKNIGLKQKNSLIKQVNVSIGHGAKSNADQSYIDLTEYKHYEENRDKTLILLKMNGKLEITTTNNIKTNDDYIKENKIRFIKEEKYNQAIVINYNKGLEIDTGIRILYNNCSTDFKNEVISILTSIEIRGNVIIAYVNTENGYIKNLGLKEISEITKLIIGAKMVLYHRDKEKINCYFLGKGEETQWVN